MKANAIVRIVIFSIVIVLLLTVLVAGIASNMYWNTVSFIEPIAGGNVQSSGTVLASQIENLEIKWVAGSITIQTGDTDQIQFKESGGQKESSKMVWIQSNDTLTIQYCKPTTIFGISLGFTVDTPKDLVITVPKEIWRCEQLTIDSASTAVTVKSFTANEAELNSASGECVFLNCDINDLNVNTVSGNIRYVGTVDTLECEAVSADITGRFTNIPDEISMEGVSGDLKLILPSGAGFRVEMETVSGDFSSDFATSSWNGAYVCGNGECEIDVSGVSGDVSVNQSTYAVCTHLWDEGVAHNVPGTSIDEILHTCLLCGETESEPMS